MAGAEATKDGAGSKPGVSESEIRLHASCVALNGRGLLILGASGSGKSGLALTLMALGATLVADDRVILSLQADALIATGPTRISGLIEARGLGLLNAGICGPVNVVCAVDLDQLEPDRLPYPHEITYLGVSLPLLFRVDAPHFPAAVMQYLKAGRQDGR